MFEAGTELSNRYINWLYPAKYYVAYGSRSVELTLGDSYAEFGRGFVLSVRKQDELASDTTIRGLRATTRLTSGELKLRLSAVAGSLNPLRIDESSGRYLGTDDGGTLSLAVLRAWADGGVEAPDAGSVAIVLQRTPEGFLGETRATGFTGSGTPCPVAFPTEVVSCTDAGLTLRAVSSTAIDEGCRPAASGPPPVRQEQQLLRGPPDAGR